MTKLVIEISHAPFGQENAYAGLFVAMGWVSVGNDAVVVLRGEGIYAAKKGQMDPLKELSLPPTEKQVLDVLEEGGRIVVDRDSLEVRGMDLEALVPGVEVLDSDEIGRILLEDGEKLLTF
jgi:predicted peroxiredoxin